MESIHMATSGDRPSRGLTAVAATTALAAALTVALTVALAVVLAGAPALAQEASPYGLRGEFGVGPMLSDFQRTQLGYDGLDTHFTGRLAVNPIDWLSVQVSVANGFFPSAQSAQGTGRTLMFTAGLRLEPLLGHLGRPWVDINAGLVLTGTEQRPGVDVGVGFEFRLARWIALGPMARYSLVAYGANDAPSSAQFLSVGVSITLRVPREETHLPRDTDGDGILDPDDVCPTVPAGAHPDPSAARRGCPLADTDSDGVYDDTDPCPSVPAGAHPDGHRPGCPVLDTDADGVLDDTDPCPSVPAGAHPDGHRPGCPAIDTDLDGFYDDADQCPTVSAGLHPDPDRPGCPLPDRDRDIVPDTADACPDTRGAPSVNTTHNGCPGLLTMDEGAIHTVRPVFFATNRDVILPTSNAVLAAVADALSATPMIHRMTVEGHTDDRSSMDHNMDLSNRRAASVLRWLTAHGIDPSRLESHGYGPTRPLRPIEGLRRRPLNVARAANRRVEFVITDPPHREAPSAGGVSVRPPAPAPNRVHHGHHRHHHR